MNNREQFDRICGDCEGVDVSSLTPDDVRRQAAIWAASGDPCSEDEIEAAIAGLAEYRVEKAS